MSDNTATNLVIGTLAPGHEEQLEAANSTMQKLGITRTRLLNKPYSFATKKRTDEAQRFGIGVTTPDDMAKLLRSVLERKAAHPESCKEMLDILRLQQDRELAARLLPFDEDSTLWIANKTGSLDNVKNDVGVVGSAAGSYLYAIFCDQSEDPGESPDNRASIAVAEISRALYRHFMER